MKKNDETVKTSMGRNKIVEDVTESIPYKTDRTMTTDNK